MKAEIHAQAHTSAKAYFEALLEVWPEMHRPFANIAAMKVRDALAEMGTIEEVIAAGKRLIEFEHEIRRAFVKEPSDFNRNRYEFGLCDLPPSMHN
jgi:hypothetical protein